MLSFGDSKADRACKLECIQHLPPVHEFVGPVKIVLMDLPKSVYTKKMWISALIGFAWFLIGATVMTVLFYTISFKTKDLIVNIHIGVCTVGLQLFMPAAILMQSPLHGPSATLKQSHRKCHHILLQFFALSFTTTGGVLVVLMGPSKMDAKLKNLHCIAGMVPAGLTILAMMGGIGACIFKKTRCCRNFHAFLGILTFLSSSVCFCIAVFTSKSLKEWVPTKDMIIILLVFCGLYTFIIVLTAMVKTNYEYPET